MLANITASGTVTVGNVITSTAQITTGAGAGKIAVSDATGNVIWTNVAPIISTMNIVRKTSAYTLSDVTDNVVLVDLASGNVAITIPSGVASR
ncbi:hypothetical protein ACQ9BO_19275 [Flavobacterium sp. P21]|uniref:hypothetical protein n=1 Tax=Flavobacterium sp. P21 TaxID=3423948 RepID=UPI003D67CDCB